MEPCFEDLSHEVESAKNLLGNLHHRIFELEAENQRLLVELKALRATTGHSLTSEDARRWVEAIKAADPAGFNDIKLGDWIWDAAKGYPTGGGLRCLIQDLTAIPGDDSISRISWDSQQRTRQRRNPGCEPQPYPPRFANHLDVASVLRHKRDQAGLADLLQTLTKDLRNGTKVKCIVEICFLLYGDDAVRMMSTEPLEVLDRIQREVDRANRPHAEAMDKRVSDFFLRSMGQVHKRTAAFAELGLQSDASKEDIKTAYRAKAFEHHPDQGGDVAKFHRLKEAYELLTA